MDQSVLRDKRVFITGSAGVIGSELIKILIGKGANLLSMDRNPLREIHSKGVVHRQVDLSCDNLDEVMEFKPQIIYHLAAAFERSKESADFWPINWRDNTLLSHRITDIAKYNVELEVFIFASSYLGYSPSLYLSPSPRDNVVYLKEDSLIEPRNITGASKFYSESELEFIKEYYNPSLRIVNARIYRVYGCGSRDIISRWIRQSLSGGNFQLYNKENRFDYISAYDVAEGLVRLAESPEAEGPVNLGSGVARSVQDVWRIISEHFPEIISRTQDMGSVEPFEASCADLTKLKRVTGWVPPTTLDEGIRTVLEFERAQASKGITHA